MMPDNAIEPSERPESVGGVSVLSVGIAPQLASYLINLDITVTVVVADSFNDACKLLAGQEWDLFVVSQRLPDLPGEEFIERARQERPSQTPILFCAHPATPSERLQRLTDVLGVKRIFFEPISLVDVAREIENLLGLKRKPVAAAAPTLQNALAGLWEKARPAMLQRLAVLESAGVAILHKALSPEAREEARREAHKLAGSLGTYGFADGTRAARIMEEMLETPGELDALRFSDAVMDLDRVLWSEPLAAEPAPVLAAYAAPRIVIVTEDSDAARPIAEAGTRRGFQCTTVSPLRMTQSTLIDCEAIIWAAGLEHLATADVQEVITELAMPLIVIATRDAFLDRVEAARLGARTFLNSDASPAMVVDATSDLLASRDVLTPRVLAVDDDETVLRAMEKILAEAGFELTTLNDPLRFWEELDANEPDLIILDQDMPGVTGIELCRVIRCDARWVDVPVLMLTSRRDSDTIHRAFQAGADDYVSKPLIGPELISRLRNRLERKRLSVFYADTDQVSGVATRRRLTECLEQYIERADTYAQPVSLAIIDVDSFHLINTTFGQDAGDMTLREVGTRLAAKFSGESVIARWSGDGFAVALYGMECNDTIHLLAELLEGLGDAGVTLPMGTQSLSFSAGVAQYGTDGISAEDLYIKAEAALETARKQGGARIVGATSVAVETDTIDVLVVEDDETVADLLLHALKVRGYSVHWLNDGLQAQVALTGNEDRIRARLVLLDVDLPGVDGISILRELRRTGVLQNTRVIILTARSTEPEVLKVLELDAFDHIAKPFSIPVLLQRVRRALAV